MIQHYHTPAEDSRQGSKKQQKNIDTLISNLASESGIERKRARLKLVMLGDSAVPQLIDTFKHHRKRHAHWEAAKALSQIGSPKTVQVFLTALEDDDAGVRWLAAEGLITIGRDAVKPLLEKLQENSGSVRLREGAHHVLHDFVHSHALGDKYQVLLAPVLRALDDIEPPLGVPIVAASSLRALDLQSTGSQPAAS